MLILCRTYRTHSLGELNNMNIFVTSKHPSIAALDLPLVHRNKMIVEYTQMLSTTLRELLGKEETVKVWVKDSYKNKKVKLLPADVIIKRDGHTYLKSKCCMLSAHVNHPCSIWVRESLANALWLRHVLACLHTLDFEHRKKYSKAHDYFDYITRTLPDLDLTMNRTPFVLAMPAEYKQDSVTKSYQDYMNFKYKDWLTRDRVVKVEFPQGRPAWLSPEVRNLMEAKGFV